MYAIIIHRPMSVTKRWQKIQILVCRWCMTKLACKITKVVFTRSLRSVALLCASRAKFRQPVNSIFVDIIRHLQQSSVRYCQWTRMDTETPFFSHRDTNRYWIYAISFGGYHRVLVLDSVVPKLFHSEHCLCGRSLLIG